MLLELDFTRKDTDDSTAAACLVLLKFLPIRDTQVTSASSPEVPVTNRGIILPEFTLGNQGVYWTSSQSMDERFLIVGVVPLPQQGHPWKPLPSRNGGFCLVT